MLPQFPVCDSIYHVRCYPQSLMMNNPAGAVSLAKMVVKQVPPPLDVNTVADLFLQVCAL